MLSFFKFFLEQLKLTWPFGLPVAILMFAVQKDHSLELFLVVSAGYLGISLAYSLVLFLIQLIGTRTEDGSGNPQDS